MKTDLLFEIQDTYIEDTDHGSASASESTALQGHLHTAVCGRDGEHPAEKYLRLLDPDADKFTFQIFDDKRNNRRQWLTRIANSTFQGCIEDLTSRNGQGAGVFVTVNETDLTGRKIENVTTVRAVWQEDDDGFDGALPLEPSLVVETSPGRFHRYWLVADEWPCDELGKRDHALVMDAMVEFFGSDPNAKDIGRVLRLPGFLNQKRAVPFTVRIVETLGHRYTRKTIIEAFCGRRPDHAPIDAGRVEPASPLQWDVEKSRLREALRFVPAYDRQTWRNEVGAALHHVSRGSDDGYEAFDQWSKANGGNKYKGSNDTRTEWDSFDLNHRNPKTVASLYAVAKDFGWTGDSTPILEALSVPTGRDSAGGELTEKTMTALRKTFARIGHDPSAAQWEALEDNAITLEKMAEGNLKPLFYLSSIDPGVGKTQTLVHFCRELLASANHSGVSVLIGVGRLKEIDVLVRQLGLEECDFAVAVSNTAGNETLNALGNANNKGDARVLFTTQQFIESKCKSSKFGSVKEFHYKGRPRDVRVWDEAILPAKPVCIDVAYVEGLTNVVAKIHDSLLRTLRELIACIHQAEDRSFIDIPDFEEVCGVNHDFAHAIFEGEKDGIRDAVDNLWLLAGRTVVVRRSGVNKTVLDYSETLPRDLTPILVLDASGRVRQTYPHWSKGRGDLVELKRAEKNYANLKVHIWRRGGGKQAWKDNWQDLVDGIARTILTKPDEAWLVVRHKVSRTQPIDVRDELKSRLPGNLFEQIKFIHWGDHSASNEYRDIRNVILAGTLFYEAAHYEALGRLSRGLTSTEMLATEHYRQIEAGEHAHLILQALCRGSVRKSLGSGCFPCDAYIVASSNSGIPRMLEAGTIFPGCEVAEWCPIEEELSGKSREAYEYVLSKLKEIGYKVQASEIRNLLQMDKSNFNNRVVADPAFVRELQNNGVAIKGNRGRGGTVFERVSCPIADDDDGLPF